MCDNDDGTDDTIVICCGSPAAEIPEHIRHCECMAHSGLMDNCRTGMLLVDRLPVVVKGTWTICCFDVWFLGCAVL